MQPVSLRVRGMLSRLVSVVAAVAGIAAGGSLFAADKDVGIPAVEFINAQVAAGWADIKLQPAPAATDGEWCRRVHLDVIGRVPTVAELDAFLADPSPHKQARLVDRLLGEDSSEEYASNWTDVWTTLLIGRSGDNDRVNRSGMRQWLRRALARNIPYDQFMHELVTANGVNKAGEPGFNGATNFLAGKLEENGLQATARTAQIFLGLQVQCTQCHNHPFNTGRQNQFWEVNAFFRQTRALRRFGGTQEIQAVELVDEDFRGEGGNPEQAELYYELRNGLMKVAYPVFIDGTAISASGYLPGVMEDGTRFGIHRRRELAGLIAASPLFPRAQVNRLWGHFLGHGFTRPVDDLGDHNPPSHPELLTGLADRFREHSFNTKELVRWIVLSRPYGLSSKASKGNATDDPATGEPPRFSRFYLRQMRAEELYQSLLTATEADAADAKGEKASRPKDQWLAQFIIAFGTDEGDDATTFNGSIPQVLMMFNGGLMKTATAAGEGGFLDRTVQGERKNAARLQRLYMAALARKPSRTEIAAATRLVEARQGDAVGALQDVWWAVLNSNEFILNH